MSKKNKKDLNDLQLSIQTNGDELAKAQGYENAKQLQDDLNAKMENPVKSIARSAMKQARDFTQELALAVLSQDMGNLPEFNYLDIVDKFQDADLTEGNQRDYIASVMTGHDAYDSDKFVPNSKDKKYVEKDSIAFFKDDGTTNDYIYLFKKRTIIQAQEWIKFFKTNTLSVFIANLKQQLSLVFKFTKYDKFAKLLKNSAPQTSANIVGTATDAFSAITQELLPLIRSMGRHETKYNYKAGSKNINVVSNFADLNIFVHPDFATLIETGIKTQLPTAQLLNFEGVINQDNLKILGNELVIGDENTPISVSDTAYIDKNSVYIVPSDSIKIVKMIQLEQDQAFAENASISLVLHVWEGMKIINFKQFVKYSNPNLNTLPE